MPLHAPIRPLRRLRSSVVAASCAARLCTAGFLPTAHAADRHPLMGSRPAYATPAADAGPVPGDRRVSARLYLNSRDPRGLAAFLRDVTDPRSPHYRHFLTPAQYQRRFGPADRQIQTVTAWLARSGFIVTGRTPHYLRIGGPARAVRQAFGTSLHRYRTGRDTIDAPSADLSVPASLGSAVLGVTGLSLPGAARPLSTPAPALDVPADGAVCSGHFGQKPATNMPEAYGRTSTYAPCPYIPAQLRHRPRRHRRRRRRLRITGHGRRHDPLRPRHRRPSFPAGPVPRAGHPLTVADRRRVRASAHLGRRTGSRHRPRPRPRPGRERSLRRRELLPRQRPDERRVVRHRRPPGGHHLELLGRDHPLRPGASHPYSGRRVEPAVPTGRRRRHRGLLRGG
ncbi:hypothetical protein SRB17_79490 [Streptomyces sp. RB17]|nr:hypothetical protein [Streptomyces sp. RB17]